MLGISLRPIHFSDASLLMAWENNPEELLTNGRTAPYTFTEILNLIDSSQDFLACGQMRYIVLFEDQSVGLLDFFQYKESEMTIEIGILIADTSMRNRGFASEAIEQGITKMKEFGIEGFIAKVKNDNLASVLLFEKLSFKKMNIEKKETNFDSEVNNITTLIRWEKN